MMLSRNTIIGTNSWCYFFPVLMSALLLASCVPTTLNTTGSATMRPSDGYAEIKEIDQKISVSSQPSDAEVLIEKSRNFIKAHPKFTYIDHVYCILGATLLKFDRPEEAITILEEFIKYYPVADRVEDGLLTLGLAHDKISEYDKADEYYDKLVNNSKYSGSKAAANANRLLDTDRSQRKGVLEGLSSGTDTSNLVGLAALDFNVVDIKGESLSLEQYRGQVVLLDFWATWCPPCLAEMPNVKRTYERFKNQKFEIIGISLDRGKAELEAYVEEKGLKWRHYYDSSRQVQNMYQVQSIPSTFLIDSDGIIRKTNLRGSALESAVAQLVQENTGR